MRHKRRRSKGADARGDNAKGRRQRVHCWLCDSREVCPTVGTIAQLGEEGRKTPYQPQRLSVNAAPVHSAPRGREASHVPGPGRRGWAGARPSGTGGPAGAGQSRRFRGGEGDWTERGWGPGGHKRKEGLGGDPESGCPSPRTAGGSSPAHPCAVKAGADGKRGRSNGSTVEKMVAFVTPSGKGNAVSALFDPIL